jgi:MFS family permease
MPVLLLGRILGGLSTSLLFTAFESWMVSEHRKQGFPEELLAGTFSIASAGNGLMAIIAGLLAQRAAGKENISHFRFIFLFSNELVWIRC